MILYGSNNQACKWPITGVLPASPGRLIIDCENPTSIYQRRLAGLETEERGEDQAPA